MSILSSVAEALKQLDEAAKEWRFQLTEDIATRVVIRTSTHTARIMGLERQLSAQQGTFDAQRRAFEEKAGAGQRRADGRRDELAQLLLKSQRREEIALSLLSKRARAKCNQLIDEL